MIVYDKRHRPTIHAFLLETAAMTQPLDRRTFLHTSAAATGMLGLAPHWPACPVQPRSKPRIKLAVKFSMVATKDSIFDKFKMLREIGFQGVELDSPNNLDRDEVVSARDRAEIDIHGVIDSVHWRDTLSHPDAQVRDRGRAALLTALRDAHAYKAETVLLVPGVVNKDVTYEQCWERSRAEIKKVLPEAEKLGVKIAIEVVWNHFITKPEQLIEYVDSFDSTWVGAYFDCSNMIKFGVKPGDWIRQLGQRMLKFDFKGYSKEKGWVEIGEGDEDWPDIRQALAEIGYHGWATAEVGGGGRDHLTKVYHKMKHVLDV